LVGKAPHLVGKAPHLVGKAPHLVGKAPHLVGKAPHYKAHQWCQKAYLVPIFFTIFEFNFLVETRQAFGVEETQSYHGKHRKTYRQQVSKLGGIAYCCVYFA